MLPGARNEGLHKVITITKKGPMDFLGYRCLMLVLSHLRHYQDTMLNRHLNMVSRHERTLTQRP